MEQQQYNKLLTKYFDGETSLAEEQKLKMFLRKYDGYNEDFLLAKNMMNSFDNHKKDSLPLDFNTLIENEKPVKIRRIYAFVSAVAASLIIGLSLMFLLNNQNPTVIYAYVNGKPITNKTEALQYSQQAIMVMKTNLNKGTQGLNHMQKINKPVELLTVKN